MDKPKSTRLRFVKAETAGELTLAVSRLPFKVELKTILQDEGGFTAFFVLPEHVPDKTPNVDLTE